MTIATIVLAAQLTVSNSAIAASAEFEPPSLLVQVAEDSDEWHDITNRHITLEYFLDENGVKEARSGLVLQSTCTITIVPDPKTGFQVRYRLLTINETEIERSLQGTNSDRQARLPAGKYVFQVEAIREAGMYSFDIGANCQ